MIWPWEHANIDIMLNPPIYLCYVMLRLSIFENKCCSICSKAYFHPLHPRSPPSSGNVQKIIRFWFLASTNGLNIFLTFSCQEWMYIIGRDLCLFFTLPHFPLLNTSSCSIRKKPGCQPERGEPKRLQKKSSALNFAKKYVFSNIPY